MVANESPNEALQELLTNMGKKRSVAILTETKLQLQQLCKDYPDIVMLYFADRAIKNEIKNERIKRNG
jgi:hypothetical protein